MCYANTLFAQHSSKGDADAVHPPSAKLTQLSLGCLELLVSSTKVFQHHAGGFRGLLGMLLVQLAKLCLYLRMQAMRWMCHDSRPCSLIAACPLQRTMLTAPRNCSSTAALGSSRDARTTSAKAVAAANAVVDTASAASWCSSPRSQGTRQHNVG